VARTRKAAKTLLLVGEGDCEVAFLKHLKSVYAPRNCGVSVTVHNAHGKCPEHIVNVTYRFSNNKAFDCKAALLDTDIEKKPTTIKKAQRFKIVLIDSNPCIEGLLLNMLGEHVPATTRECKARISRLIDEDLKDTVTYQIFTKEDLEQIRTRIPEIDELIRLLQGEKI